MDWTTASANKRSALDATIPPEWRLDVSWNDDPPMGFWAKSRVLTPKELTITEMPATLLVQELANGKLTAVAVTTAFCKRAALAHQLTNCLHEFFPDLAIAKARSLDEYFAKHKKVIGPLHGLPISLKDQARIKGVETSMGYVSWLDKKETEDSALTMLLEKAGAVLYVKTSVPQTLLCCETINNVFGRTINPRNRDWSCGGSSGGEGAIVAMRGSIIGVGTDLGGSIRVPAAFNSLFGLRPSHGRLPYAKLANTMEGQEAIHSVCGPICHSIPDMRLFVQSILSQNPWMYDSKVVPMPWRKHEEDAIKTKISSRSLTIGYYSCDGNVLPHPPILRAVEIVKRRLAKAGHMVVPWQPYKHAFAADLASRLCVADGGTEIFSNLRASGEPAIPNIDYLIRPEQPKMDVNELWNAQLQKWNYQNEYLEKIRCFEEKHGRELDAIIAPTSPYACVRHNKFNYYGYATVINVLDYTSVVIPVTFATKSIDRASYQFAPLSDLDRLVQAEYDPEAYHGAPAAVQVIGRRLTEERIMCIAEELVRLLRDD
ncbi:Acetamidase [Pestalotiopsis fici W106-1]|uniref:amidase n=1 Tax=Pestalotiopsis fici (strain W106-1 / CGMCC3.15140) TaxID=1229662 RepID=W3WNP7_PESFW|nr:Acetamidase [Pestalotiopsis fici W106-1]ETS75483.1 Acetamidase [Pestalotiopsis fici W106-1]